MDIKITVTNHFTGEKIIDTIATGITSTWDVVEQNHKFFRGAYPDCQVNFVVDHNNFIFAPPLNQERDEIAYDEGHMTWEQYCNKWYKCAMSGCNEDGISDDELNYQIDMLLEQDWAERDSICY